MRRIQKAHKDKPFRPAELPEEVYAFLSLLQRTKEVKELRLEQSDFVPEPILKFSLEQTPYHLYALPTSDVEGNEIFSVRAYSLWKNNEGGDWVFVGLKIADLIPAFNNELKKTRKALRSPRFRFFLK